MKIAVLLSGGVDSSTALRRLLDAGFTDITAYYLKIWLEDDTAYMGECPWEEDMEFARAVCDKAGVDLQVVPLQLEYYDKVVSYALAELKAGRTPSPDIFCNERIKFGAFLNKLETGCDKVASGHYAQVDWVDEAFPGITSNNVDSIEATDPQAGCGGGRWRLLRAPDPVKDQTYFLSHLSQEQLSKVLFPVGDLLKPQVRQLAQQFELANRDRPDSQGICFLGKIRYPDFVRHYLGVQDGPIVERESGRELGRHEGFWFHTVGQRTGLKLGNGPWYVAAKDSVRNIVYVSHGISGDARDRSSFEVSDLAWTIGRAPLGGDLLRWNTEGSLCLKLRHGPQLLKCSLVWSEGNGPVEAGFGGFSDGGIVEWRLSVQLEGTDAGIAAGQFAVFYRGEECLGSGKICEPDVQELERYFERYETERLKIETAAQLERDAKRAKKQARFMRWQDGKSNRKDS